MTPERSRAHRAAHPPPRADRAGRRVLCLVSGGADSTCLYHALRELGYRVSALHVDHGLRGAESDADAAWCAEQLRRRGRRRAPARCATEAELRDVRYSFRAERAARDRPHALRPGRDDPLPARVARDDEGDRGAPRRRRRAAAALRVARGDRGVLPRARARVAHRLVEPGDAARPDPQRDPAAARAHPSGGARERAARARRAPDDAACARRAARRRRSARSASTSAAACRRCASTTVSGSSRARVDLDGPVDWGAWRIESALPGLKVRGWRPGDRLAGRRRRFRTCSSTPRSRAPTAKAGRSSCAATRSWRCPGSSSAEGVSATRVAD